MGLSLGDLFDPVDAFGGNSSENFNAMLDPFGAATSNLGIDWFGADLHDDVSSWGEDVTDFGNSMWKDRWNEVRKRPGRALMSGGDSFTAGNPVGTRINNEVFNREDTPMWDIYGGPDQQNFQNAADKGIDTSAAEGVHGVGSTIGKGVINYFTAGLGSTALDAMDAWGRKDNQRAGDILKNGVKNYALNYVASGALDGLGGSIPETGGYNELGGGYVGNNEFGGTGGFNLGKTVGAGDYAPVVNDAAKGAVGGAVGVAGRGGNSNEIGKGATQGGLMAGAKTGADMGLDYLNTMFAGEEEMPDVGTLGGTMQDEYGENSVTLGGEAPRAQLTANATMPMERSMGIQSSPTVGDRVSEFLTSMGVGSGGGGQGGGNYGDLAAGLFGMYNANRQRKRLREQSDSLNSLFSPNSPYAQQARQRMERRDAAAGRRSQYGPREAQLAALLADRQAQTMPQQQRYADAIGGYENAMANIGIRGGRNLYDMYRGRPQAPMMGSTRGFDPYSIPGYFGGGEGE